MPEISVIVPVYNVENKIRRCVDSILAQSFTGFELILVDDGSPDQSGEICDEYAAKDHRIKVIHQQNAGPSAARNMGIRVAEGVFIAFVDSDDYLHKDYLKALYDTLQNNQTDMVMCNYFSVIETGEIIENRHRFADNTVLNRDNIKDSIYRDIFFNTNTTGYFSPVNKLFRRQIICDNQIFMDESMSFGEDMLFVMQYIKHCNSIALSDKILYYYEMLPTGLFSKYRRGFLLDIMKCYTSLIEQTKPDRITKYDYLPLSKKYWYYVDRHICGIIKNENNINELIREVLSNKDVRQLFKRIAVLKKDEIEGYHITQNKMRVPRLVSNGRIRTAALVARYQLDSNFWLRKLRSILHI